MNDEGDQRQRHAGDLPIRMLQWNLTTADRCDTLRTQRVTSGEIRQAVRLHGIGGLDLTAAVVLETDGTLSVIPASQAGRLTALYGVDGAGVANRASG
jgi:hypothetical protein